MSEEKKDNYLEPLQEVAAGVAAVRPGFTQLVVYHDAWCDLLQQGGICNCQPEIQILGDKIA